MIEWWSRTRAVFRAHLGADDYEHDIAVWLRAPKARDPDLALWLHQPAHLPAERLGLRSPVTVHRPGAPGAGDCPPTR